MRDKLLSRLYEAFDRDPQAVTALVLSHPDGIKWQVSKRVLTVGFESGANGALTFPLDTGTVDQLAASLTTSGVTVLYVNADIGPLHPAVLIDGSGAQSQSNGNIVTAYRSMLWALISAYAKQIEDAQDQVPQAIAQAYLHSAGGDWLDFWGGYFGIARGGHGDDVYLATIIRETLRPRSNALGIENAITDATGYNVIIEEPWKEIFKLDASLLSGHHGLYDGIRYGYHLIRPVVYEWVDWAQVNEVIERNRAAGVLVATGSSFHTTASTAVDDLSVTGKATKWHKASVLYPDRVYLDFMDDISDIAVINYKLKHLREMLHPSGSATSEPYLVISLHSRTVRIHHLSALFYLGQYWSSVPSWQYESETWKVGAIASTNHTRS